MNLITPSYKEQNRQLHSDPDFGATGKKWARQIYSLCEELGTLDILDYGCGKRGLEKALGFAIKNYDPATEDNEAQPADLVVCLDVLEHVEPDCIDSVLDHLKSLVKRAGFFTVATRPAQKHLPDGRNAHLIQEPFSWWFPKIESRFRMTVYNELVDDDQPIGFSVLVRPK